MSFQILDKQLYQHAERLRDELKLQSSEVDRVATLVAAEVRFLDPAAKRQIVSTSPVPLNSRLDELMAFQSWMDWCSTHRLTPPLVRAQVISQNYICFVYLPESCFRILRNTAKPDSVTRKCCKYLTDNPVRAFRNAVAHSNWTYAPDFSGLVYWARKGHGEEEPVSEFNVDQRTLGFWQMLSRGVAYAAFTTLGSLDHRD